MDFLLPAWADQGGWGNPQMYLTIQGADVDGDGTGELLGRNAAYLEVFEWGVPSSTMGPDAPGQWSTLTATGALGVTRPVPGPPMAEADSFFDPSVYTTIQAADLDGDAADEVFYRSIDGVEVFDLADGAWTGPTAGPPWGDANALGDSAWEEIYYGTIQAGDVDGDGDDEILGRTSQGIQTWARQANGSFLRLETGASPQVFANADGWTDVLYTQTIQLGELDGTPGLELLARASQGLTLWDFSVTDAATGRGVWSQLEASGPWTDAKGWNKNSYAGTITTADLDGDGVDEVVGRSKYGLDAYHWDVTNGWVPAVTAPTSANPGLLTDADGYTSKKYFSTIQTARLLPTPSGGGPVAEQLIARGVDGVHVYALDTTSSLFTDVGSTITQMSDANHWDQPPRFDSIHPVDIGPGQSQAVVGKDATGIRTYVLPALGEEWVDPTASYPSWTDTTDPDYRFRSFEGYSYWYINVHAVNGGTETSRTVLDEFQDLTADLGTLETNLNPQILGYPKNKNIPHQTFDDVRTTTLAWTEAAQAVRAFLGVGSGAGGSGVSQLMHDSFVIGQSGNTIEEIGDKFRNGDDPAVLALIGDLIWGALGAIPGGAFIDDAVGVMAFTSSMSVAGSGVAAGVGFANPNGSVNTEAKKLQQETVDRFCTGIEFLNTANGQIAGDLGQLTVLAQMKDLGVLSMTSDQYNDALTQADTARQVWAYQQFASMDHHGWRLGHCTVGQDCVLSSGGIYTILQTNQKPIPTDGVGTPNCDHDPGGSGTVDGWSDVLALGVDPVQDVMQPYVSSARSSVGTPGEPYEAASGVSDSEAGILGWRIPTHSCHS